jgi:hypothetical protein
MNRTTLISIGVFVALGLAYVATREKEVSVGIKKFVFPKVNADSIDSIEVSGAQSAKLSKENGKWFVIEPSKADKKFAADESAVKSTLDALADFKAPDFVTEKNEKQTEYEIDSTKGLNLKAMGSGVNVNLVLGKAGKNGGTYVRLASSSEIYTTQSGLAYFVKKDVNGWRNRAITVAKLEDVTKINIRHADGEVVQLGNEGSETKLLSSMPAGFRFDAAAARNVVSSLSTLSAQGFSDGETDEALGLVNAAASIEVEMKEGKSAKLIFGSAKPDGTRVLRVQGDAQVYLVPSWQFDSVARRVDGLRDLSLMNFDVSKVTKMEVSFGSKKAVVQKDSSSWKLLEPKAAPAGFEFDAAQVNVQLERLKSFRASRTAANISDAQAGIGKPSAFVEVTLEGGAKQALRFGSALPSDAGVSELYLKGSADSLVYAGASGQRSPYENPVDLFKKPPPAPDWANAKGLDQLPPEIREQLMQQMRQQQPH